jgi:hypothetical protein
VGLGDLVNKVGDGLEHAASSAEHALGTVADKGAHAVGGVLDSVGLHGAADAVDNFGDSAADHLGAQVAEQQLGQTNDPKQLVHGDVGAIQQSVGHLQKFAAAFEETAQGLNGMDTSHWNGDAADAFQQALGKHVPLWSDAGEACSAAAQALDAFAHTVQWAQSQAQEAIELYNRGQQATQQAQAQHAQQVAAYNQAAQSYNQASAAGQNSGPPPQQPGAFSDPGNALRQQAQEILDRARQQRDTAATQAQSAVSQATSSAPQTPSFSQRMLNDASDAVTVGASGYEHMAGGILKGAGGIVKFARTISPTDPYNMTHPAEYVDGLSNTAAGLVHSAMHPTELIKGLVGTGWSKDPAEAFGKLLPNVALTAATDGAGSAAAAGEGVAERAAVSTAEDAAESGAERGAIEDAGQAAEHSGAAGSDPLHAAVNHNVDLSSMPESPTWRESSEPLYRGDGRSPDEIFQKGFEPKDVSHTDLRNFVETNRPSAFVSTSRDPEVYQNFPSQFRYTVEAPGGIDVNATLGKHVFSHEQEIAFPGGVDPRFIRGAHPVIDGKGTLGEWIPNPGFNPY